MSLDTQRSIIGYVIGGIALLVVGAGIWGWRNYSGRIMYGITGQSDIRYVMETREADESGKATHATSVTTMWYKAGGFRMDVHEVDEKEADDITYLARCDTGKLYTVNFSRKIFTDEPLSEAAKRGEESPTEMAAAPHPAPNLASFDSGSCAANDTALRPLTGDRLLTLWKSGALRRRQPVAPARPRRIQLYKIAALPPIPRHPVCNASTGKRVTTYQIESLGNDTIADVPTIHYRLTSNIAESGCAGNDKSEERMDVWVAPSIYNRFACNEPAEPGGTPTPVPLPEPFSVPTPVPEKSDKAPEKEDSCKVTEEEHGNADSFATAFRGLVMKMQTYEDGKLSMEQEVREVSTKSLERDNFSIEGLRGLTSSDFWAKIYGDDSSPSETPTPSNGATMPESQSTSEPDGTPEPESTPEPEGTPEAEETPESNSSP